MFFKTVGLMTNIIATVNKIRKMEEDDQITPKETYNEPYICSSRVSGKFNFYLDICMKSKYYLYIFLKMVGACDPQNTLFETTFVSLS